MWRAQRRFLSGPGRSEVIADEVLGTLEGVDELDAAWAARSTASWGSFAILMSGKPTASPEQLLAAREVHWGRESLYPEVREIVERFAADWPSNREEILGLEIDAVWVGGIGHGNIFFKSPSNDGNGPQYRCSYVNGKPSQMAVDT